MFGLMLSAKTRERFGRVAGELGFTPGQLQAILELSHADGPLSMRELAEQLDVDASYMTGIVDHLERNDHVVRGGSPTDRRVKLVSLTDRGRSMHQQAFERFAEPPDGVLDRLDDEEVEALGSLLAKAVGELPVDLAGWGPADHRVDHARPGEAVRQL
jgi:MarR family 2-MHQ and catechol resistance regulon transcriptional repressor